MNRKNSTKADESYSTSLIGFLASLTLTFFAFLSHDINLIIIAALLQFSVQIYFFIHLGYGNERRWNVISGVFVLVLLLSIAFGTIWIMNHLRNNMMPAMPQEMYINGEVNVTNETRP